MRILPLTSALFLLAVAPTAYAQDRTGAANPLPKTEPSSAYMSKESAAMADAAREKTEALERARDKRMKSITRGICTGC